jgi:hypothetical protein
MANQIGSGNAEGLVEYLNQLGEKGRVSKGSITAFTSTLKQVLSTIDGNDNWKNIDIRSIDTEDYIQRFKTLTIGKYTQKSYGAYLSRLNKIKDWYTKFLLNPGWVPMVKTAGNPLRKHSDNHEVVKKDITNLESDNKNIDTKLKLPVEEKVLNDLVAYPFPLRPGKVVTLYLPIDLTIVESKRLGKFIESLSIDGE